MLMLFVTIVVIHIYSDVPWGRPRVMSFSATRRRAVAAPKSLQTEETPWMQKGREGQWESARRQSQQLGTPQTPTGACSRSAELG